ncbi:hypothetical protein VSS37_01575 [Candidatus Thiothrix sp. Deng01]|uniref:Uncharacterized protein n=1 Tax=Candidatus Thiothrix phosphatis TaxID=3112415 RepID=A0ABU6CS51_9GAMM|nr:hypothetical protein [Candidatus Thiothrix sp. Deng01]MEB4589659.1 hypothetical protein [Candidatus Thiothrix sp. Deng01]
MQNFLLRLSCLLFLALGVSADPLPPDQVPEPLKPWVGWVLDGHQDHACPYLYNAEQRQCAWPGSLDLQLTNTGGVFTQHWETYAETRVRLPGDAQHWPQQVHSGENTQLAVTEQDGYPSLLLPAGSHDISGQFFWDKLPEALFVAPETGLVKLSVNGAAITSPEFNAAGSLWLSSNAQEASEDNLDVQVFRKVEDAHPLQVTTSIQLRVAGKQRQAELAPVLLAGFIPLRLDSPLPARMGQDGKLQVQLRPGEWTIQLTGRAPGSLNQLALPASSAPWPSEEVWVFAADSTIRQTQVEGVNSIDPSQTRLPPEWASLPAYLMTGGGVMKLAEQHRGIADSPAQLSLKRQLWLDFDGGGYTLQDQLQGTLAQESRLETLSDIHLGRVSLNGEPQLITRQPQGESDGVEVRQRTLDLDADSRYDARQGVPVNGWRQELQQVTTTLHLPPGWLLFAAWGTDNLAATWLQQWNLLDLFLVLLIVVATGYLYGWRWGAVAGAALLLTWHLPDAPRYIWLNLLAVAALLRALPEGAAGLRRWLERYRWLSLLVLALVVLPFLIGTVRIALYPQLTPEAGGVRDVGAMLAVDQDTMTEEAVPAAEPAPAPMPAAPVAAPPPEAELAAGAAMDAPPGKPAPQQAQRKLANSLAEAASTYDYASKMSVGSGVDAKRAANLRNVDPNSMIQTGPGLPNWQGDTVLLTWSGVITPEERADLWLVPPLAWSLLKLLGVAVLLAFALRLALLSGFGGWPRLPGIAKRGGQAAAGLLLVLPLWGGLPTPADAEPSTPPADMLQTLQERLLRAPDCLPECAQIDAMDMLLQANSLAVHLRVHAAIPTAIPLPGGQNVWLPQSVLVDGVSTQALRRDGEQQLWVGLNPGQHDVVLQGELPARSNLALPLRLKPHRVTWQGEGWQVDGLRDNGVPEDQLQLNRTAAMTAGTVAQDTPTLPAFVKIRRRLDLGLDWYVNTTITRVSDSAVPITLSIPLLAGEQPLSEQFTVKDNAIQVNLKPQQDTLEWTSRLPQTEKIQLTAADNSAWLEEWQVAASPVWHVQASGLPVNAYEEDAGQGAMLWKPWAGETLTLAVNRPQGVEGQTVTILASQFNIEVGKRAREMRLSLNLLSSRGSQHAITLPDGAELKSLTIDGVKQSIQQQGGKVMLPLSPARQKAVLEWQEPGALPPSYRFPALDLGLPSVNSEFRLQLPQDRWVLWAHGPLLGPAVLFWGMLAVLLAVAALLGRSGLTPLKGWQWFLLGIGLSQTSPYLMVLAAGWLAALAWRGKAPLDGRPYWQFNLLQVSLAALTLFAFATLIGAVAKGLLGLPEMQVAGNGSWAQNLLWYQDRSGKAMAQPLVISVPLLYYRLLMLAWALWLAVAVLDWLRWGWRAFGQGGLWRRKPSKPTPPADVKPPDAPQTC